ncbi:hypothetical protein N7536_009273 [Penicillium majusculum]|uniref:HNH nuclease domain-containing protein n=1 Tax=Penicillium solitum TaxID=60172 RepID=A0A1V6R379_9EURO|nr:uncharacterized protein PENSOL_c018G08232 [Penicillium solitum]KAJ5686654.1 hypothetical protein N7536_009273 [Penicillium majusculum]OQD95934.1 hypothetical protein PENSOL_c018G08232 [Penicillium solitum]
MEKVNAYQPVGPKDKTVSILRAFHTHLPENGKANFVHYLRSLQNNQELHDHAQSLIDGLVAPLRSLRSIPSISPRFGMEDSIDNIASESPGPIRRDAYLKKECLARDSSRCVVTRLFDEHSLNPSDTSPSIYTEFAYIIPFSLISWSTESESYAKHIIWTNLIRYFPTIQAINFTQENINDTANAITMSRDLHQSFGQFDFSFEETSQPHKYRIQNYRPRVQLLRLPRTVIFNCYDQRYDLPHPELLKVHAIIARIFHASGAAEQVNKALRDLGEHCVLAKDGSTDISSMLAVTTLGVLGSRAGNVQQTRAALLDSKPSAHDCTSALTQGFHG